MKLNEYQVLSRRTMPFKGCPNTVDELNEALSNYCLGLAGETGEVIDHIKKYLYHGHTLDCDKVKKELGDVQHYANGLATLLLLTMEDVCTTNIEKLMKRFPNGFSTEDSIRRVDTDDSNK